MQYFNKLINITLKSDSDAFTIKTPKKGRKPNISISGELSTKTQINQLEIKITNLYTSKDLTDYKTVVIEAGYESQMSTVITGTITSVFTSKPGPDKETTILCSTSNLTDWLGATVNFKIAEGTSLQSIAEQLSTALGFEPPYVSAELKDKTLPAPAMVNGLARTMVNNLKILIPNMNVIVNSNRLFFLTEKTDELSVTHTLKFLTQAPQYSGANINICAPWIPSIKPGDLVKFPTTFYSVGQNITQEVIYNTMNVSTVQFSFGTYGENEMTVSGVAA